MHLITDESIGSVARGAKSLQQQGTLGDGSILVSTVGFERIMGAPFRLVEPDSMPAEQATSIEWLQGQVRDCTKHLSVLCTHWQRIRG